MFWYGNGSVSRVKKAKTRQESWWRSSKFTFGFVPNAQLQKHHEDYRILDYNPSQEKHNLLETIPGFEDQYESIL